MKYAIVISSSKTKFGPVVFRENLLENIIKAKNIGYDAIEFAVREPKIINISNTKKVLEKYNLFVPVIGTGQIYFEENLSFSNPDKYIRNEAVNRINEIVDLANNFNSSIIIGLIRGNINNSKENFKEELEAAEERISKCLQKCLDYSESFNTHFLIEPLIRYNSNIFNKIEDVVFFLEKYKNKLDLNRLGVLADTYHMNVEENMIDESFQNFSASIKHIHFSDSNRWAPVYGHIDFSKILEILKRKKYNGVISFEILPLPDPDTAARKALEYIKGLENKSEQLVLCQDNNIG